MTEFHITELQWLLLAGAIVAGLLVAWVAAEIDNHR